MASSIFVYYIHSKYAYTWLECTATLKRRLHTQTIIIHSYMTVLSLIWALSLSFLLLVGVCSSWRRQLKASQRKARWPARLEHTFLPRCSSNPLSDTTPDQTFHNFFSQKPEIDVFELYRMRRPKAQEWWKVGSDSMGMKNALHYRAFVEKRVTVVAVAVVGRKERGKVRGEVSNK